jgi:hypothetical protein
VIAPGDDEPRTAFFDPPLEDPKATFDTARKPVEAVEQIARNDDFPWFELREKFFESLDNIRLLAQWERNGRGLIPPEMHVRKDECALVGKVNGAIPKDTRFEHGREFVGPSMSVSVATKR